MHDASLLLQVYGVQAQNVCGSTPFYQEVSDRSGGAYVNFKNFSIISDMFLAGKTWESSHVFKPGLNYIGLPISWPLCQVTSHVNETAKHSSRSHMVV